jgi:hypothetical protein
VTSPPERSDWGTQADLLLRLGQVAEARVATERALARSPTSLTAVLTRVMVEAAADDVPAARQVLARASRDLSREALVTYVANTYDLGWLLDADQERLLLTVGADAFDGDRGAWAHVRAEQYGWRGDAAMARGDSAARESAQQLHAAPADPQRHVLRWLALAYAGHGPEALAEAARGLALQEPSAAQRE